MRIDHVHVYVSDQYTAAKWYEEVLGLKILAEHEHWAVDGGPLTISADDGNTSIALFNSADLEGNKSTIAFRLDGSEFLEFVDKLEVLGMRFLNGENASRSAISDHEKAYSVYFADPDGNPIEVTTYDYDVVASGL